VIVIYPLDQGLIIRRSYPYSLDSGVFPMEGCKRSRSTFIHR